MTVPLGVPVLIRAADLANQTPSLASGEKPLLHLQVLQCAVLLLIREAVAPLISVRHTDLNPLQGAPGLATIYGDNIIRFGSQRDCSAAAGGHAVGAGIIVLAPAETV